MTCLSTEDFNHLVLWKPRKVRMSSGKHFKTRTPSDRDLKGDPGIGRSKGAKIAKADPLEIEGEHTFEGDVENDPGERTGAIRADKRGRTNR
jgi:hypothetical protein